MFFTSEDTKALAHVSIIRGVGEEVALEKSSQGGGGAFGTYVSLLHSLDLGIIIAVGDDVARGQVLEVNDDAKVEAMEQADAGAESAATTMAGLFEGDLFPNDADDGDEGERGEDGGGS